MFTLSMLCHVEYHNLEFLALDIFLLVGCSLGDPSTVSIVIDGYQRDIICFVLLQVSSQVETCRSEHWLPLVHKLLPNQSRFH